MLRAGSAGPCNARVHDNAATSRVVVTTLPAGATLIVDGKAKGATPTEVDLSFGSHELKVTVGDRVGTPKDAVQPGRRIATLRHRDLGLGLPVAVMTPHRR